eukprot:jgi/Mesvir1/12277/Mv00487-RA.1
MGEEEEKDPHSLHVRRNPFVYGLLPLLPLIPRLSEGVPFLRSLKDRFLTSTGGSRSIPRSTVSAVLGLSDLHATVVLETLVSVLPDGISASSSDNDGNETMAEAEIIDSVDLYALLIFLYLQNYHKPLIRPQRDAATVADHWPTATPNWTPHDQQLGQPGSSPPGHSHFGSPNHGGHGPQTSPVVGSPGHASPHGYLAVPFAAAGGTGAMQQYRRRSAAEEDQHNVSYMLTHTPQLLSLIQDGTATHVTPAQFDVLGLILVRANETGAGASLSKGLPLFTGPDGSPLASVPTQAVLDWMKAHVVPHERPVVGNKQGGAVVTSGSSGGSSSSTSYNASPGGSTGGGGLRGMFEGSKGVAAVAAAAATDVAAGAGVGGGVISPATDAANRLFESVGRSRKNPLLIQGLIKTSVVKDELEVEPDTAKILDCHETVVYLLAPLAYASVSGCTDSTIVIGAVGKVLKVEHCERVQLIVAAKALRISNCTECTFFLGVNRRPLLLGENRNLLCAPYNTYYAKLDAHLEKAGVDPSVNLWNAPVALHARGESDMDEDGVVDGVSRREMTVMPTERFIPFIVPFRGMNAAGEGQTRMNPFSLPSAFAHALEQKVRSVSQMKQAVKEAGLEESRKKELQNVILSHFKDWLQSECQIMLLPHDSVAR